jgi:hypothetical protein
LLAPNLTPFPTVARAQTAELHVSNKYIESRDSVAANLDPSRFSAPNTFDTERDDWMHTVWGLPLWRYYKVRFGTPCWRKAPDAYTRTRAHAPLSRVPHSGGTTRWHLTRHFSG